jgi:hypothetical protein
MHQEKPRSVGWGRPNLVCSVEEKMLETILKDGMTNEAEGKHSNLGLHKILAECNDNLKTTLK